MIYRLRGVTTAFLVVVFIGRTLLNDNNNKFWNNEMNNKTDN